MIFKILRWQEQESLLIDFPDGKSYIVKEKDWDLILENLKVPFIHEAFKEVNEFLFYERYPNMV